VRTRTPRCDQSMAPTAHPRRSTRKGHWAGNRPEAFVRNPPTGPPGRASRGNLAERSKRGEQLEAVAGMHPEIDLRRRDVSG